MKMLQ